MVFRAVYFFHSKLVVMHCKMNNNSTLGKILRKKHNHNKNLHSISDFLLKQKS